MIILSRVGWSGNSETESAGGSTLSVARSLCLGVIVCVACQPTERDPAPPGGTPAATQPSDLSGVCWTLDYGPATAGLPDAEAPGLPPHTIRIWTDSTFPNSEGLLQVEAAPGSETAGSGMVSTINAELDSIEVTWAAATSSTHLRLRVFADSMSGTAWHHGASGGANDAPRSVRAAPTPCAMSGSPSPSD